MPRKSKKKSTKVTISLAELHDHDDVGKDPELAALPTAPKSEAEWAAEGGRPVFGRRRREDFGVDSGVTDEEFAERDWTRRGPLEAGGGGGEGRGDFGSLRRGPMDGAEGEERGEVDFSNVRRGPVDADFGGGRGGEVDFSRRKGPIDADFSGDGRGEVNFSKRVGPVEADFSGGRGEVDFGRRAGPIEADFSGGTGEVDFRKRTGPVEADFSGAKGEVDFAKRVGPVEADFGDGRGDVDFSRRKGPVEAEFGPATGDVDFSQRKGPVEAEFGNGKSDVDFGVRKGPVEAESKDWSQRKGPVDAAFNEERRQDWSQRKGPVDAGVQSQSTERKWEERKGPQEQPQDTGAQRREVEFGTMRRGSKLAELEKFRRIDERRGSDRTADGAWKRPGSTGAVEASTTLDARTRDSRRQSSGESNVRNSGRSDDWSSMRRGPTRNSQPSGGALASTRRTSRGQEQERDWSSRRGPLSGKGAPLQSSRPNSSRSERYSRDQSTEKISQPDNMKDVPSTTAKEPLNNMSDLQDAVEEEEDGWSVVRKPNKARRGRGGRGGGEVRGRGGRGGRGTSRGGMAVRGRGGEGSYRRGGARGAYTNGNTMHSTGRATGQQTVATSE